jgi:Holliday junction resolvase RusA-like endonuclease
MIAIKNGNKDRIEFVVTGDPKPQPRARAFKMGNSARMYDPGTADGWKQLIANELKAVFNDFPEASQLPQGGPVQVIVDYYIKRPKGHYRTGKNADLIKESAPEFPAGKPDLDNLNKAVYDVITQTQLVWKDDSQIVIEHSTKNYAYGFQKAGAHITIEWL